MNLWGAVIAAFIVVVTVALVRAHFKKDNPISLLDLVTRDGALSTTMILQLVGGVVGTWVVIKVTVAGSITWDLFAIYLAYVASVDGFSKVVSARYGGREDRGYYGGRPYRRDEYDGDTVETRGSRKTPIE